MALESLNFKTIRLGSCLYDQWLKEKSLFEEQLNAVRYDGELLSSEVSAGDFLDHLLDLHRRICRVCRSPVNPRPDLATRQLKELRSQSIHGSRISAPPARLRHDVRPPPSLPSPRSQSSKTGEASAGCEDSATESHAEIISEENSPAAKGRPEQDNAIVIEDDGEDIAGAAGDIVKTELTWSQEQNKERSYQADGNRSRNPPQNPGSSQSLGTAPLLSGDGMPGEAQSAGLWGPSAIAQEQDQMAQGEPQSDALLPSQDSQSFSCWDCGQRFDSMDSLQEHCLQGSCPQQKDLMDLYRSKLPSFPHGDEDTDPGRTAGPELGDQPNGEQPAAGPDLPRQGLTCSVCAKVFSNKTSLGIHMKGHQPPEATSRPAASKGYPRSRETLERLSAVSAGYPRFTCLACKQKFRYWNSLEVHIMSVHGGSQYSSLARAAGAQEPPNPDPSATSQTGPGVEAPPLGNLADVDLYQFPKDGRQLPSVLQPSLSMEGLFQGRRLDKRLQKHICTICHKLFSQSNNLKRHMRIHTNEKPYKCDVCLRSFAQSNTLKEHKHIHSNHKGYSCSACGKRFRQRSSIDKHKKINSAHGVVECSLCGQRFAQKCTLRSHMASHMAF